MEIVEGEVEGDEFCELCCGTGWVTESPKVIGVDLETKEDILEEGRTSLCRCATVQKSDEDEDEEVFGGWNAPWMGDDEDEDDNDRMFGGALVLA